MSGTLSLKGRALRMLASREHSRVELERKLTPHEEHEGQIRALLEELQAKGFVNEQRVAESLVHRRGARLGTKRVIQEMRARGVDGEAVAAAAEVLRQTELERARAVFRKKFGEPAADSAERSRQLRFMASRGFSPELVLRLIRQHEAEQR